MAKKPNSNKISTEAVIEEVDTVVTPEETVDTVVTPEETVETVETVETIKIIEGVVSNCIKLNVRKEPKKDAKVLATIDVKSKVDVEPDNSTDEWYKISTKNGIEGYCMKDFIALKK